jgi:hypothetical protein
VADHGSPRPALRRSRPARGQQFVGVVGLDDVVVGAGVEAGHAVPDRVARGGHQHRHRRAAGPQAAQHLQAVGLGQAEIQQDQVVLLGQQGRIRRRAIADPVDRVVLGAQDFEDGLADHRVIFHK